uniref:Autophagy-related protein n=1 Tax=Romanomermis culicivorax TaxID=13658 RepID=A0A915HLL5_ROMCU
MVLFLRKRDSSEIGDKSAPYRTKKDIVSRQHDVEYAQINFPNKVPVIVEKHKKDKRLPCLDRCKFLSPPDLTLAQFLCIIRNRMQIPPSTSLFLFNEKEHTVCSLSSTVGTVYEKFKDKDDGFLYLTYAAQEAFG